MRTARDRTGLQPRPARPRWCDGLPDVTATIDCDGHTHRITWRRGKLVLEDHDVLAERSLVALGAERPACLAVLDAWRRRRGFGLLHGSLLSGREMPPEELAYRRQRYERHLGALDTVPARLRADFEPLRRSMDERERRMWEITLIEALPAAMRRALARSVLVTIERNWDDADCRIGYRRRTESLLAGIVNPLLEESARHWRRNLKPYASFVVDTHVVSPGDRPTCAGSLETDGAAVVLRLPIAWLVDVWAHGAALVDGCFVLGRAGRPPDATSLPVTAVRWERGTLHTTEPVQAPALLTRGEDGAWALQWC